MRGRAVPTPVQGQEAVTPGSRCYRRLPPRLFPSQRIPGFSYRTSRFGLRSSSYSGPRDISGDRGSGPGDLAFGLLHQDLLEKTQRLGQTFARAHETIFMLDRECPVVADQAQGRDEIAPEPTRVAVTDRAE